MADNTITGRIRKIALEELEKAQNGLKYSELHKLIMQVDANFNSNTVNGSIWDLDSKFPDKIYKPARGVFKLIKFRDIEEEQIPPQPTKNKIKEESFYKPFADWLINELEECTKAIPLGGNKFKDKWGTPDVIGKRETKRSDILQAPTEIISAEIKIDTSQLITAFGQACSYRLFSHKSYLVIPDSTAQDDIGRLDSLCIIFDIGLILFDNTNPENPNFAIRVRATKSEPDIFYVNQNIKKIESELF